MALRLTELNENEIKLFIRSLSIEPDNNFFYGKKKNTPTKKALWFVTSNPIWNVLTEKSYVIVFDNDLLYLKKAFSFMNFGSFDYSKNICKFSLKSLENISLVSDHNYIYFNFIINNEQYSFYFDNHKFNSVNYENLKKRYNS